MKKASELRSVMNESRRDQMLVVSPPEIVPSAPQTPKGDLPEGSLPDQSSFSLEPQSTVSE